jgi:hypothetical protein
MYDPIVLEDLTEWVNDDVGVAEARVADVKEWCLKKGVCCVSSATFRGRERKRF